MINHGVFLVRFQPLHNGHLTLIKMALAECQNVLVVLGSENKCGMVRNPFDIITRKAWLERSLTPEEASRVQIITLPDWSTETDSTQLNEWGHYLYYNIVANIEQKKFAIYYNDDINIIKSWFDKEVKDYIEIRHFDRSTKFEDLSATKIRQAVIDKNMEYLNKFLPKPVLDDFDYLYDQLTNINKNPKEDFSME